MTAKWQRLAACGWLVCLAGCPTKSETPAKKTSPADVAHIADESQLDTIVLTVQAEERLAIVVAPVKETTIKRRRTLGAEVVLPPGRSIVVSAPIAGTVSDPPGAEVPQVGSTVERDAALLAFTPLLTPEREVLTEADRIRLAEARANLATSQIEAERQIEVARVQYGTAETGLARAKQLERDGAGSRKAVEDAEAALSLARETLLGAQARNKLLAGISLDMDAGQLLPREVLSPIAGTLRALHVAPGETVGAGEPLFEIIRDDHLWLRVPVYAGAWRDIDAAAAITLRELGDSQSPGWQARPILAPPVADAASATVDLYYQVDNTEARLRPGQRVSALVTLLADEQVKTVPWAAILHDYQGGTWVYERTAAQTYIRRRVTLKYVIDEEDALVAVLDKGPAKDAEVVTDGAAELFGTEFGFGK